LTESSIEQYAEERDKRAYFINMTTVLLLLGIVEKRNRIFRVGGTNPQPFSSPKNVRNGKSAA